MAEAFVSGGGGESVAYSCEFKANTGNYDSIYFTVDDCDLIFITASHDGGSAFSSYRDMGSGETTVLKTNPYGSITLTDSTANVNCGGHYYRLSACCTRIWYDK